MSLVSNSNNLKNNNGRTMTFTHKIQHSPSHIDKTQMSQERSNTSIIPIINENLNLMQINQNNNTKEIAKANNNKFSIEFSGDDSFIHNIEMNISKLRKSLSFRFKAQNNINNNYCHTPLQHSTTNLKCNYPFNIKNKNTVYTFTHVSKREGSLYNNNSHINKVRTANNVYSPKSSSEKTQKDNCTNKMIFPFYGNIKPLLQCFICGFYKSPYVIIDYELISTKQCFHIICSKCAKNYYEEQIEQGHCSKKCPKYSCNAEFEIEELKQIVSSHHYNSLLTRTKSITIKGKTTSSEEVSNNKITLKSNNFLSEKHVIDLVEKEQVIFEEYLRLKSIICFKCQKPALFGKNCRDYVKCLNCELLICKYCSKEYNDDHLNIRSDTYCKVYFRTNKIIKKIPVQKQAQYQLAFFIVGYLFLLVGIPKKLLSVIYKENSTHNIKRKTRDIILYYVLFTILFCVNIIFFVMFTPFYPLLLNIFD